MRELTVKAKDGLELSCALFECENPKALIQVIHGAKEHKGRYYNFCEFLCNMGYTVIVSDNRGHGMSINAKYFLGHFDSLDQMVSDQYEITKFIKELVPDKSLYMFGHSFGSLIARNYLQEHDNEIEKLVTTGTVFPVRIAPIGKFFCTLSSKLHGGNSQKGLASKVANSGGDSWVCANPYTIREFRNDPLVQSCKYTNAAAFVFADAEANLVKYKKYKCKNENLTILMANGEKDIFRGTYIGEHKSKKVLNKIGYTHIFTISYPKMKHEIINELDKASVYSDIVRFYNS